jgi:hypothetical protein
VPWPVGVPIVRLATAEPTPVPHAFDAQTSGAPDRQAFGRGGRGVGPVGQLPAGAGRGLPLCRRAAVIRRPLQVLGILDRASQD